MNSANGIRDVDYERITAHTDRSSNGCLISRYSLGSHGYPQAWDGKTVVLAHRVVWIHENGPIDEGMTVDHTCKTRRCLELTHLRLIPNLENARRTSGRDWELGKCVRGHDDATHWRAKSPTRVKGYCAECRRLIARKKRRTMRINPANLRTAKEA